MTRRLRALLAMIITTREDGVDMSSAGCRTAGVAMNGAGGRVMMLVRARVRTTDR